MIERCVAGYLSLLTEMVRQCFDCLVLFLNFFVSDFVDVIFVKEHFYLLCLLIVPLIRPQNCIEVVVCDIAAHSDTVLFDQLFEVALVIVENHFFVAHDILEEFVWS